MSDQSDEIKRASEPAEAAPQGRTRDWLRLSSNVAVGIALVGIPWTYVQPNGPGLTFSFVCFFVALMLRFAASSR
jgi:hypothetical protein